MPRKQLQVSSAIQELLSEARVARLATLDSNGAPHIVPVCFVYAAGVFYSAVDRKPKRVAPKKLARLRNIRMRSRVALLIDDYHEDWTKLWYVLIRGTAQLLPRSASAERTIAVRLLRAKYPQYAAGMLPDDAPIIRITHDRVISWGKT
jgi:coenzyme F420-0:L-glutamate ligase/coenzyme F420-1:gamma-L-glutamate ligase